VFVANPSKPADIEGILYKNRAKLVSYLSAFQNDKDDPQFLDEKRLLISYVLSYDITCHCYRRNVFGLIGTNDKVLLLALTPCFVYRTLSALEDPEVDGASLAGMTLSTAGTDATAASVATVGDDAFLAGTGTEVIDEPLSKLG
jgi:Mo25-like